MGDGRIGISACVGLVGLLLLLAPWWKRRRGHGQPTFTVETRIAGREWLRLAVTNSGKAGDFSAQVVATENSDPEPAVPWFVRWKGGDGEVRRIDKNQTCLLDLAEADPMGTLDTGGRISDDLTKLGRFRFHSQTEWVALRIAGMTRTIDLQDKRFVVAVEVRSGSQVVPLRLSIGYDDELNIVAEEVP